MRIRYGYCKSCQKSLFNFKHHEMTWCSCNKSAIDIEELYSRIIGDAEIREGEIQNLIEGIREQFVWTSNYDKDMRRIEPVERFLKDLDTDHILNILNYLTDREIIHDSTRRSINIMVNELKYRHGKQKSMGI
jgi:hypothetical protein